MAAIHPKLDVYPTKSGGYKLVRAHFTDDNEKIHSLDNHFHFDLSVILRTDG
jgi:hypothetical protein